MKKTIILLTALLLAVSARSQSFQQAFFLDGYRLGYRYNPALQNQDGFLSVGQWENQNRNNFGAASFLYPRGDELVTGLHSSVSAQEFLGNLKDDNYFNNSICFNLVSYGWRKEKAYHTLEAGFRASYSASFPKEIFTILKLGTGESHYDLGGLSLGEKAFVELAYGYSRKLSDYISVGARAKLLVGLEALSYRLTRLDLTLSESIYEARLEADLDLTSSLNKITPTKDGYLSLNLSSKDRWRLPSGGGLAVDLGVVATPVEGLTLSASIVDLGGIFWYYGNAGKSQGTTTFTGMDNLSMEEIQEGKIGNQFQDELDALLASLKLKSVNNRTLLEAIPFNVNLAAKYQLPFYRALALGATGNYVSMKGMNYWEARGVLAWNPWNWLGVTANAGGGEHGAVWGAALNVAFKKFRLTAAYCDGFGGTIPYTSTPLKANNKMLTIGLTYDL